MIALASAEKAHAGDRIARPLTGERANVLNAVVHAIVGVRIHAASDIGGTVHLHPDRPVTAEVEVHVLAAVLAVTDAPVHWHGDIVWGLR